MFKKKEKPVPTAEPEQVQSEAQTPVEPVAEPIQEPVVDSTSVEVLQVEAEQPSVVAETEPLQSPVATPEIIEPELPASTQTDEVIETPKVKDTIEVDKRLFYKMMATCIKGSGYTGFAAMARFAAILGAIKLEDQKAEWKKAQEYLRENK